MQYYPQPALHAELLPKSCRCPPFEVISYEFATTDRYGPCSDPIPSLSLLISFLCTPALLSILDFLVLQQIHSLALSSSSVRYMPSAISQLKLLFPPSPPPPSPGAGAVFGLLPPFDHAMTLEMTFGGSWSTGGNEPSTPLPGPPPEATGIFPDSIAKLVVWLADLSRLDAKLIARLAVFVDTPISSANDIASLCSYFACVCVCGRGRKEGE